jgi:serine/threonine protein kinase
MKMSAAAQQQQQQIQQRTRIGNYEIGKTLGEGTFAKVKYGRHVDTGASFAIKIIDKDKILKHKMVQQIKREISTMKLVKHPNIVQIFEVSQCPFQ